MVIKYECIRKARAKVRDLNIFNKPLNFVKITITDFQSLQFKIKFGYLIK